MDFLEWFKPRNKYNKWLVIILFGVVLICFAISQLITLNVIEPIEVLWLIIQFIVGVLVTIFGVIGIQKRTLEIFVESNGTTNTKLKENSVKLDSLIFDKNIYDKGPKVVLIGGGAGTNSLIKGLRDYTRNLTVLVPLTENSKEHESYSSKNRLSVLPYSNIKENIAALSNEEDLMRELLSHDFTSKQLEGLNFGDIYLLAMQELFNNVSTSIKKSTEVLNINGEVVPISLDPIKVCAELTDGTVVETKEEIPKQVLKRVQAIKRVFISPNSVRPTPRAIEAIKEADIIVIGPGNIYTDIIPTLLVKEMVVALKESKAQKVYSANIMTDKGQTDGYTLSEHIKAILDHTRENIFDYCIADTGEITPEYLRKHHKEGTDVVEIDSANVKKMGIKLIEKDLSKIVDGRILHNPEVIALTLMELVLSEKKYDNEKSNLVETSILESILREQRKKEKRREKQLRKANKNAKSSKDDEENIFSKIDDEVNEFIKKRQSKFTQKYNERIKTIQEVDSKKDSNNMIKNFFNQQINQNKSKSKLEKEKKQEEKEQRKQISKKVIEENKFNTTSIHKLLEQKTGRVPTITEEMLKDNDSKNTNSNIVSNLYSKNNFVETNEEKNNLDKPSKDYSYLDEIEKRRLEVERLRKEKEERILKEKLRVQKLAEEIKKKEEEQKLKVKEEKVTKKVIEEPVIETLEEEIVYPPKRRGRPRKIDITKTEEVQNIEEKEEKKTTRTRKPKNEDKATAKKLLAELKKLDTARRKK